MKKLHYSISLLGLTIVGLFADGMKQQVLAQEVIKEIENQATLIEKLKDSPTNQQVLTTTQIPPETFSSLVAIPQTRSFVGKAADLLPSANSVFSHEKIAQRPVDIDQFCKDYPLNSRCTERPAPKPPQESKPPEDTTQKTPAKTTGWAITPEVSTLGLGASVTKSITPNINGRIGVYGFSYGTDIKDTDVTYKANLNLFNVSTLVDYHPWKKSGFRLSAGLVFNDNNIKGNAQLNSGSSVRVGDQNFNANDIQNLRAKVSFPNSPAPYLGIGWGNAVKPGQRWGFALNLGVMFTGTPNVDVTGTATDPVINTRLQSAIATEKNKLKNDLDWLSVYPVLSLGVSYQF